MLGPFANSSSVDVELNSASLGASIQSIGGSSNV